jgi:hypothetical protein
MIVHGGSLLTTSLYNPATHTMGAGAALGFGPTGGSFTMYIPTGTQGGKFMTMQAGAQRRAMFYDPVGDSYATSVNQTTANVGGDAWAYLMTSGANPNKIFVALANGASTTNLYDLASDTWAATSPALTAAASPGTNGFLVPSGGNSGKLLVLHGALTSSSFYDPSGNTMGGGPALTGNMGGGSCVFSITAGPQMGKVMVVLGGNQTVTNIFDPSASTFSAGPSLTANANGGAQCFSIL